MPKRSAAFLSDRARWQAHWLLLALILVGCAALPGNDEDLGLLWRVDKDGQAPSYVFGTMHVEDERVVSLARPVRDAFETADVFVMETLLDDAALADIQSRMFYTEGSLKQQVTPAVYQQLVTALAERGLPQNAAERMKPWAALSLLSTPNEGTGMFLDRLLQSRAEENGKAVYGLETVDEQVGAFEKIPEPEQIVLLEATLASLAEMDLWLERTTQAYVARDLTQIALLNEQSLATVDANTRASFNRFIVTDRNHLMVERMRRWLASGNAFVAVGALHLPGKQGILALLRNEGYTVTAVY